MADRASAGDEAESTEAFSELQSNLEYARDLVTGGQFLESLKVGVFDVAELYRAAWVQAVSALDHWVHREVYDRALAFALNVDLPRPRRFRTLEIPMELFEAVHHHEKPLREAFTDHLRAQFGYLSFQAPEKIKDALRYVSDVPLWPAVAKRMSEETGRPTKHEDVQALLKDIVGRRNRIAHEADSDPSQVRAKQVITAQAASEAIESIHDIATAIRHVLGPPPAAAVSAPVPVERHPEPKTELYRQFWTRFQPFVQRHGWSNSAPPPQHWWDLPGGVTGTSWVVSFTQFGCRSELYFNHPDAATNLARWEVLAVRSADIIERFGDDLIFDELPGRKACRIETRLIGPTVTDQDRWPDLLRWMEDTQLRLRAAVDAVDGVPKVTA
ncbi:DUF4268 domain-containing protein [Kutzneria sp. CA-103260]|uniref:DUF4268 domain-containing protein n=1 Tax=Kutzneria sp. CA-103260 TaxID=2802641 RepID=UPI001BA741FD|nr:DUF4268 domain-containing protein [Kutzneria sp. CA-103260]QUQ62332.1 hypothetical protein JJ691_00440 [Kutzneria sp. CA-103260]